MKIFVCNRATNPGVAEWATLQIVPRTEGDENTAEIYRLLGATTEAESSREANMTQWPTLCAVARLSSEQFDIGNRQFAPGEEPWHVMTMTSEEVLMLLKEDVK